MNVILFSLANPSYLIFPFLKHPFVSTIFPWFMRGDLYLQLLVNLVLEMLDGYLHRWQCGAGDIVGLMTAHSPLRKYEDHIQGPRKES